MALTPTVVRRVNAVMIVVLLTYYLAAAVLILLDCRAVNPGSADCD
jgi:hypothetical protein